MQSAKQSRNNTGIPDILLSMHTCKIMMLLNKACKNYQNQELTLI